MENCIFCKIIKGDIPNYTVYEDSYVLAFLDINPRAKGHTVVISKNHAEVLQDFNDELLGYLMSGVKRSMEKIDTILQPEGYNVGWNHGQVGGQEVPHLHIHILPRYKGDGGGNIHSIVHASGDETVEELGKLFDM